MFSYSLTNLTNDEVVLESDNPLLIHSKIIDLLESGLEVNDIGLFILEQGPSVESLE